MLHTAWGRICNQVEGCSAGFGRRRRGSPETADRPVAPRRKAEGSGLGLTLCWIGSESEGLVSKMVELECLRREKGTGRFTSSHGVLSHQFSGLY